MRKLTGIFLMFASCLMLVACKEDRMDNEALESSVGENINESSLETFEENDVTIAESSIEETVGMEIGTDNDGNVLVNSSNFPDECFRSYIKKFVDTNGDEKLSTDEIDAVELIFAHGGKSKTYNNLESLEGIEYFTNLKELQCYDTQLKTIDCSTLEKLETLEIQNTDISELDISNNRQLKKLDCYSTKIKDLDVSNNTELEVLNVHETDISKLDVSMLPKLRELLCSGTNIEDIDVSQNEQLQSLDVTDTSVSKVDISKNRELMGLYCINCAGINDIDITNNEKLQELRIEGTGIPKMDLSACDDIYYVSCNQDTVIEGVDDSIIKRDNDN